jgi:hypothetical protein
MSLYWLMPMDEIFSLMSSGSLAFLLVSGQCLLQPQDRPGARAWRQSQILTEMSRR